EPTPEQTAMVADLHWLIHQGHVIEFANGVLELAKKPVPKPPRPETKPAAALTEPPPQPEAIVEGEIASEPPVGTGPAPIVESPAEEGEKPGEETQAVKSEKAASELSTSETAPLAANERPAETVVTPVESPS